MKRKLVAILAAGVVGKNYSRASRRKR